MQEPQSTSHLVMIRPGAFYYDSETAVDNKFQVPPGIDEKDMCRAWACQEFDHVVEKFKKKGLSLTIFESDPAIDAPGAVFPNNWFTSHADGTLVLYPMKSPRRRREREAAFVEWLVARHTSVLDLRAEEDNGLYLEGTGALVLDRPHRKAYVCRSARISEKLLDRWCVALGYSPVVVSCVDAAGVPIYHTNVMMSVTSDFVILFEDGIVDKGERNLIKQAIADTGKAIVTITWDQVAHFCGNVLEVNSPTDGKTLVMSATAYQAFSQEQKDCINRTHKILHAPLEVIEHVGGGGIRCMMAELFV